MAFPSSLSVSRCLASRCCLLPWADFPRALSGVRHNAGGGGAGGRDVPPASPSSTALPLLLAAPSPSLQVARSSAFARNAPVCQRFLLRLFHVGQELILYKRIKASEIGAASQDRLQRLCRSLTSLEKNPARLGKNNKRGESELKRGGKKRTSNLQL